MGDIRSNMVEQIAIATKNVAQDMLKSLIEHLIMTMDQRLQQFEAQIARSHKQHDMMMNSLK